MGPNVPSGYRLDESDSDVLVLRRQDGSFVAAFSARGATTEGIVEAAEEDRRRPTPTSTGSLDAAERLTHATAGTTTLGTSR